METNGLELPKRKVEYLKFLGEAGGPVKTSMIAERFRVDPSTVTKSMNELAAAGFVVHIPYHGVELSDKGRRYTGFLVKRHRILSLMLTHFGFSDQEACKEVSRFESLVSREAVDRICRSMGHPHEGTCGKITHDTGCMGVARSMATGKERR